MPAVPAQRRFSRAVLWSAGLLLLCLLLAPLFGSSELRFTQIVGLEGGEHRALLLRVFVYARLPRVLAAAVAGAGLSMAGVAFQALLRNPLADPYTLGVSSGSSLGAVLAIRLGLETASVLGMPLGGMALSLAALLGALGVVAVVYVLGERGTQGPVTLLLAGVTLAVLSSALILAVLYTADFSETYRIVRWQMGDLDVMRYDLVTRMAVPVLLLLAFLWPHARDLNALSAGAAAASGLGVDVPRVTRRVYVFASLVVAATVSVVGPIGFVGLLVPHVLRSLVGPDHRVLLPCAALCGGAFLVLCDAVAQVALRPAVLPVGVLTALLGAPLFVLLLLSARLRATLWG